jgi:hypothetical protein
MLGARVGLQKESKRNDGYASKNGKLQSMRMPFVLCAKPCAIELCTPFPAARCTPGIPSDVLSPDFADTVCEIRLKAFISKHLV